MLLDLYTDFHEAGEVAWYSHLEEFSTVCRDPVKGFVIVNKTEVDIFLELSCFFDDPVDVGNLNLVPLPFLNPA